jgi:hypothetical protein
MRSCIVTQIREITASGHARCSSPPEWPWPWYISDSALREGTFPVWEQLCHDVSESEGSWTRQRPPEECWQSGIPLRNGGRNRKPGAGHQDAQRSCRPWWWVQNSTPLRVFCVCGKFNKMYKISIKPLPPILRNPHLAPWKSVNRNALLYRVFRLITRNFDAKTVVPYQHL